MIRIHRMAGLSPRPPAVRDGEPTLAAILLGVSAFIAVVALCLYAVAALGA